MSRISGERRCPCCGTEESNSGCVLGPRCDCDRTARCDICKHCTKHHVKNCTEAVRLEVMKFSAQLREKYAINIFDYGERLNSEGSRRCERIERGEG